MSKCLDYKDVQCELRNKAQEVHQNNLIMQQEEYVAATVYCLGGSLNLLVEEVIKALLIAVYMDSLAMISIKKSETNKKRTLEIQDKFVSDNELCLRLGQC